MRNIFQIGASEARSTARNFPRREVGETFSGLAVLQLPAWIYELLSRRLSEVRRLENTPRQKGETAQDLCCVWCRRSVGRSPRRLSTRPFQNPKETSPHGMSQVSRCDSRIEGIGKTFLQNEETEQHLGWHTSKAHKAFRDNPQELWPMNFLFSALSFPFSYSLTESFLML